MCHGSGNIIRLNFKMKLAYAMSYKRRIEILFLAGRWFVPCLPCRSITLVKNKSHKCWKCNYYYLDPVGWGTKKRVTKGDEGWRCFAASALVEPSRGLVGQRRRFRMGENIEAAGEQRHRRSRLPIPGIRSEARTSNRSTFPFVPTVANQGFLEKFSNHSK